MVILRRAQLFLPEVNTDRSFQQVIDIGTKLDKSTASLDLIQNRFVNSETDESLQFVWYLATSSDSNISSEITIR